MTSGSKHPCLPLLNLTLVGDACFKPEAPRAAAGATAATETLATLDMTNAILMNYETLFGAGKMDATEEDKTV